jgi:hypothetical protein
MQKFMTEETQKDILLDDDRLVMRWRCTAHEDETTGPHDATEVHPTYYESNGVPICGCGRRTKYVETILLGKE